MSAGRPAKQIGLRLAYYAGLKDQIKDLEKELLLAHSKHQRLLRAYLALRQVKSLQPSEAHTPALARYIQLEAELKRDDLKEMR